MRITFVILFTLILFVRCNNKNNNAASSKGIKQIVVDSLVNHPELREHLNDLIKTDFKIVKNVIEDNNLTVVTDIIIDSVTIKFVPKKEGTKETTQIFINGKSLKEIKYLGE